MVMSDWRGMRDERLRMWIVDCGMRGKGLGWTVEGGSWKVVGGSVGARGWECGR